MTGMDIHRAAALLRRGKLVAIPTETVYGLAGDALNTEAVLRIYEVKNRPRFNPMILHIGDIAQLDKYVLSPSPEMLHLAGKFWPGPSPCYLKRNP